jgi:hypothetical protein
MLNALVVSPILITDGLKMKYSLSQIKFCVYVDKNNGNPWVPTEKQEKAIRALPNVVDVDSCGAQTYHVEFETDDFNENTIKRAIESIKTVLEPAHKGS